MILKYYIKIIYYFYFYFLFFFYFLSHVSPNFEKNKIIFKKYFLEYDNFKTIFISIVVDQVQLFFEKTKKELSLR